MLTLLSGNAIKNVTFKKSLFGGYKPFDVDSFIDDVYTAFEALKKENSNLSIKVEELNKKLKIYQEEESSIRSAILSAQKLADASMIDADNKSKNIIFEASKKADEIIKEAEAQVERQKEIAWKINIESENFRRKIVEAYELELNNVRKPIANEMFLSKAEVKENERKENEKNFSKQNFSFAVSNSGQNDGSIKEASKITEKQLDENNILEVNFNKNEMLDEADVNDSGINNKVSTNIIQDIDSGAYINKKKFKNLRFGRKYRVNGKDFEKEYGKRLASGIFRRKNNKKELT